jgi:hypothetical protein
MVFGLTRRRRLPAGARPRLARDERVVAWASTSEASTSDSSVVVVTTLGVWLPQRTDRLGWHQIHKATWSGSLLRIIPAVAAGAGDGYAVMADGAEVAVSLTEPGDVPAEVRERVTRSVAYTEHYDVPGGGMRVVARRVPGVDGVSWHVRYDGGTDPTAADVVAATTHHLASIMNPGS